MLVIILVIAGLFVGVSFWLYLVLALAYSVVLFYGCYYIGSNFFLPVICSAQTAEKIIALTFDDGPDAIQTPKVLHILKNENVKAAFFCIGNRVERNPSLLNQIDTEGHIVGNHSYSHHFWFDMFGSKKMLAELQLTNTLIAHETGKTPKLFRPPYGVINPNLKKAIIKGGYITLGWNVRSMDTVIKDETALLNKVKARIKPGAIFLFHDTSNTTIAILPTFIKFAKLNGYRIVGLDEMLNVKAYA